MILQDEANVRLMAQQKDRAHFKRLRTAILNGAWEDVVSMCKQVSCYSQMFGNDCACVHACVCE